MPKPARPDCWEKVEVRAGRQPTFDKNAAALYILLLLRCSAQLSSSWCCLQAAMMDALREVSEELPTQLEALFKFDYLEQAVRVPFFQEVRCSE